MSSPDGASAGRPRRASSAATTVDPVMRNALRYTVSPREYAALHKYIIARSKTLRRNAPTPAAVEKALAPTPASAASDYNAKAVRHALRVFVTSWVGMKGYEFVSKKLSKDSTPAKKTPFYKSPALRLSLSLSSILFLYRLLFRFLTRLRVHLMEPSVEPFRRRNPRTAAALTSPYAPAVGASFAGLALGIYPSPPVRAGVALWLLFKALEYSWDLAEGEGMIWGMKQGRKRERPWWFGSWLLQPLAFGQLLHAAVFDKDCFPDSYGKFIWGNSPVYLHGRPEGYPTNLKWPSRDEVVTSLSEMARLNWPAYISPTMFPNKKNILPPTVTAVSPLTSQAHPLITSLSCAALHPSDPSCTRTYLTFWLKSFPPMARFFVLFYSAMTIIPGFRRFYHSPITGLQHILSRSTRMTAFATGSLSTAWASICFFQTYLPRHLLATQRFFLGGFFAGLWAWIERKHGRMAFLYSARASVNSLWKVGVKRRWWRAMKGGDLWVFVLALMITGVVYERDAKAIQQNSFRKGVSWVRGEGWRDWAIEEDEEETKEKDE
ncbi:hypothetical protein LMH87_011312 [Akanthomyces muscarius]|uniref:Uncharacterized protein n=1 Tax=Akanthomyces muscarius TaxID=2231603 RepID=A0A9W8Q8Y5_AKAMU|nr:hypothetical protein LMH87_011312 [Akanthomyces muscarius]KAJ4150567.1 hypothetical protein LMH87_011312 [Akanthomyces muscarius]